MEKLSEIGVFPDSNLNVTISVFTWGLENGVIYGKIFEKPVKHIILIWSKK